MIHFNERDEQIYTKEEMYKWMWWDGFFTATAYAIGIAIGCFVVTHFIL